MNMQYSWCIAIVVLMLSCYSVKAQYVGVEDNKKDSLGYVNIFQDERLELLLKTDSIVNSQKRSFTGYRIQIFFGGSTDREKAFEVKKEFMKLFPNERAYVIYTAPDFRVRVGNFRTKLESIELFKACSKFYPNCYPVKTEIMFSDLDKIEEVADDLIIDENIK
jgi:hypothetical protein